LSFHFAIPLDKSHCHLPQSACDAKREVLSCLPTSPGNIMLNRHSLFILPIVCMATVGVAAMSTTTAGELTESKFQKLHAELQPDNSALWRTIPWKTSVLSAQQIAAGEKKPIFIWAMDGHPLGCT
jgi:hypothetical protein